jgi:hypothetical protein
MTINSLRIGRDLSNVAIKFQALPEETRTRFDKIIARFYRGNVTTGPGPEKTAMPRCRWHGKPFQRQILLYTRL